MEERRLELYDFLIKKHRCLSKGEDAMGCEQMMNRMTFLMFGEDLCRVEIYEEDGEKTIKIDLHGLRKKNAERLINNVIAMYRFSFRLVLIHGYNHGTVLKELIWNEYKNERVQRKYSHLGNLGITYLDIE